MACNILIQTDMQILFFKYITWVKRGIINIWMLYANEVTEQMLPHIIDLYVNCIRTLNSINSLPSN